ncbi:MAG TPA: DUF362 domain-containing protein [bacterium]|uniref:DUF362 domain-containing protein n=1 Tax=candidate division TA06 bacterium ADurb.Bin417 TaxID=1852828 RepID=A0A1V5MLA9_UNCT6|nr:MAG: hypothetical protein BWY73_00049 [candidate division TA06 bacterium ADurb.Bin417]HNQ34457.1 DUF362 domain-containing protein [bacterium]HNS48133.1 DUF362 domain-containing protein [bacterium]
MKKVSIVSTSRGTAAGLQEALDRLGGLARFVTRGDRVMVKPNLNGDCVTDLGLTEALIRLLLDLAPKEVFIAESTFGDAANTRFFFQKSGYAELAGRYGLRLVNLNESEAVETPVARPLALEKLKLAREVFEADRLINLPKMKVHYATGVSLALKNLKGLLVGDEKKHFHDVGLDRAIVDLNNTVPVHLNIVDAITGMERLGPHGGDLVRPDLLIAGAAAWRTDCVGIRVMDYELKEVGHLARYLEVNGLDPADVELAGLGIEAARHPFKKVNMANLLPPNIRVRQRNACCACLNALILSGRFLERPPAAPVEVCLGSLPEASVAGCPQIAFGNCAVKRCGPGLPKVEGCPPYPFELKKVLERNFKKAEGN